jgi:hypothetical protein
VAIVKEAPISISISFIWLCGTFHFSDASYSKNIFFIFFYAFIIGRLRLWIGDDYIRSWNLRPWQLQLPAEYRRRVRGFIEMLRLGNSTFLFVFLSVFRSTVFAKSRNHVNDLCHLIRDSRPYWQTERIASPDFWLGTFVDQSHLGRSIDENKQ